MEYTVNGHVFIVTFDSSNLVTTITVPGYTDPNTGQPLVITYSPPIPFAMSLLESLEYILFGS